MPAESGLGVGVAVPQGFEGGRVDPALIRDYAREAEAAGFDDLWVMEQITGRHAFLEPVSYLAYLSSVTARVRLGASVLVTNLRNPVQLAKSLSTVDHLSGGRLTVGIGLGTNTRLYPAYGLPPERRVARFVEGIRVMKALWTQDAARFEGEYFLLDGVPMEPKPLQKPHPPLWFGARTEAAQRRALRFGDGWMGAGSTALDDFFVELARMKQLLAESGRVPASFPLSKRVYISVDDDEARARERMQQQLWDFYRMDSPMAEAWGVYGPAGRCLESLHRMREAGLTHLMLHPAPLDLPQLEAVTSKLLPHL